jgi:hypothetical protein
MNHDMNLAVVSERVRAPTYEELYGPAQRPLAARKRTRRGLRRYAALAMAAACVMATLGQRQRIVAHVPALARLYALAGLPVNLRGLAFRNVKSMFIEENSERVLAVEGQVANVRNGPVSVPDMRVSVTAPDGREIYAWTARSPKPRLDAGETVYFRARLNAPPAQADAIKVRFAELSPKAPGQR